MLVLVSVLYVPLALGQEGNKQEQLRWSWAGLGSTFRRGSIQRLPRIICLKTSTLSMHSASSPSNSILALFYLTERINIGYLGPSISHTTRAIL